MIDSLAPRSSYDLEFKQRVDNVVDAFESVVKEYSTCVERGGLLPLMSAHYQRVTGEHPSPAITASWSDELEQAGIKHLSHEMLVSRLGRRVEAMMDRIEQVSSVDAPKISAPHQDNEAPRLRR